MRASGFVERASPLIQRALRRDGAEPEPSIPFAAAEAEQPEESGLLGKSSKVEWVMAMKIKQKLQNPFALIAQGFVAGAIILYATTPANVNRSARDVPMEAVTAGVAAQVSQA